MRTVSAGDARQVEYVTEVGYPGADTEVLHNLHVPMREPEPLPDAEPEAEL